MLVPVEGQKVSHPYRLNLHNITNIKVEDPFILVQEAQHGPHVDLVLRLLGVLVLLVSFDLELNVLNVLFLALVNQQTFVVGQLFGHEMLLH